MILSKRNFASILLSLSLGLGATDSHAQASFPDRSMQGIVGTSYQGVKSSGTLTLASSGVSFDSPDFVFTLAADDILAVESKGAREGFVTFVIDSHSKFLLAYPTLVSQRSNSIGEGEHLLTVSLPASEAVDTELTRVKAYQRFIQAHRAEREQATVGASAAEAGSTPAHPSLGKTLHVVLGGSMGAESDGLLTFFADRLQFDSQDAAIRFPIDQIVSIDAAGARETFLHLHVNPKSKLVQAYRKYGSAYENGRFDFVLLPSEPIAPAFALGEDYARYTSAVRSGMEQATVGGGSVAASGGSAGGSGMGGPVGPDPGTGAASGGKVEVARFEAGFLERHNPSSKLLNGLKVINGIPGTVVVFDSGVGYVSTAQNPSLKATRQPYTQNGYLKFFVPDSAILSVRDVSVIRNANGSVNNSYITEVDLDRNSPFYQQSKPLVAESDQDNRLFLTFHNPGELVRFLQASPHAPAARDAF